VRRRLGSIAAGSPYADDRGRLIYQSFGANSQDQQRRVDHLVRKQS
jgi:hypothetical protein